MKPIDMSGDVFGRLTVLQRKGSSLYGKALWLCRCECGTETTVQGVHLRSKHTQSCGCLSREVTSQIKGTHGLTETKEYAAWAHMRQRCTNPKTPGFANYGGRGITVCKRWDSFESFLHDMDLAPSPKHSIDRANNDGNYTPENCRWATRTEQARNKRTSVKISIEGVTRTCFEWSEISGTRYLTIYMRLRRGWSARDSVYGRK